MKEKKPALATVVLIISVVILAVKLLAPRTIQIFMEEGQVISIEGGGYFTFADALLLAVSAWAGGMAALYLLYRERKGEKEKIIPLVLKMLDGDEKKIYRQIVDAGGEILQKNLVLESEFDKAKVTRLLNKLEEKGLILRMKHGMTNRIVLKKE